ncbi:hypothetical protein CLV30_12266 [Haloactinopolyspora alba]|uniref:Dolichyl-phosphate-mannose-protein mannosyltransferase n=1 Tax=Haloactinopolyspora alba TaxID=648780 RepID=A0A2P8DK35_9ACTN|nr:hypothetical protein [Haloactinopolyspora alba]PSK97574.1 hypothetical protein CLV30_12266 [Haloactinopolyspora alba]
MRRRVAVALVLWPALLIVARLWGLEVVEDADADLKVGAVPFYGRWELLASWRLLVPVAAGLMAVALLPRLARTVRPTRLLVLVALAAVVWSLALAVVDPGDTGFGDIQYAYGRHVHLVDDAGGPAEFLRGYVANQDSVPVHLQAHPPGLVLVLWSLGELGLSGIGVQTVLAMAGVAAGAVAAVVIVREVAGDRFARSAAPFVVLAPAAVWHTNADVVFGGVALSGVALVVFATGRSGRRAVLVAVAGGVLFGVALLLSYGVALLAVPIAVAAGWRRAWRVLLASAGAGAAVVLAPLAWDFWWLDGLAATREQYYAGVGADRPYTYFAVANLAVFAAAIGPATAAGLAVLRERRAWLVPGSGLGVVLLADLSGLSSAETERIWQPFMPLVLIAAGAVASSAPRARWWLAAQGATAVVLQAALRSPW